MITAVTVAVVLAAIMAFTKESFEMEVEREVNRRRAARSCSESGDELEGWERELVFASRRSLASALRPA